MIGYAQQRFMILLPPAGDVFRSILDRALYLESGKNRPTKVAPFEGAT